MKKIIYYVYVSLTPKGWTNKVEPVDVVEKNKVFVTNTNKQIKKEKMMVIDTLLNPSHNRYSYFIFCEDGQQQESLNMLKAHIIKEFDSVKADIDVLKKLVDSKRKL